MKYLVFLDQLIQNELSLLAMTERHENGAYQVTETLHMALKRKRKNYDIAVHNCAHV